jgi:ATP-dependent DNA ligase
MIVRRRAFRSGRPHGAHLAKWISVVIWAPSGFHCNVGRRMRCLERNGPTPPFRCLHTSHGVLLLSLALRPPFAPMEALSVDEIPVGEDWQYEPKWDGFRCLAFRDGRTVELQSKSGRSLTRYFPELVEALGDVEAERFVVDGEIVIAQGAALSFDALLQRIHPAPSRIRKLAAATPALLLVFDLLAGEDGKALTQLPLAERRSRLEAFAARYYRGQTRIRLSPATTRLSGAKAWLKGAGAALDGIIAKRRDLAYRPGDRSGMQKIKTFRTADCVVGGFRYNEGKPVVGSLLLGLYDDDGLLQHVGFTSTIPRVEKPALTAKLEKLIAPPGFTGNAPGGPSRWSTTRSGEWQPLKPKLVVEVSYDHVSGHRFRHGTKLLRWRPDKSPAQCTFEQLKAKKASLRTLLAS